ncbi:MAG: hypothetical protein ABIR26_07030 [Ramlibacter sp.]
MVGQARADLVVRNVNGENILRLMDTACVHGETLGRIAPELRSKFRKAQATISEVVVFGCWFDVPEAGAVFIVMEGSKGFALDRAMLKVEPGV